MSRFKFNLGFNMNFQEYKLSDEQHNYMRCRLKEVSRVIF